jgi:hypothetical protein
MGGTTGCCAGLSTGYARVLGIIDVVIASNELAHDGCHSEKQRESSAGWLHYWYSFLI